LATFPNTSKFIRNSPLKVIFSTLFSMFQNVVGHGLSCLINYSKLTQNCKAIGERDIQSPPYPTVTEGMGCARGVSSLPAENQSVS